MKHSHLHFVIPGSIDTRTGGYRYDKQIIEQLEHLGWQVTLHSLDESFPVPSEKALSDAARQMAKIPDGSLVLIDGLAFGVMPEIAAVLASRLHLIALVHHPLALETGLTADEQEALRVSEMAALESAHHVIVTSPSTAVALEDYAVSTARLSIVKPATDLAELATGTIITSPERGLRLLCVASLTSRKGHDTLIAALARLTDHRWQLVCAGSPRHDPEHARALQQQIASLGLTSRITLAGEMDDEALTEAYDQADVFVLASHHEGYGMVFDEALARGLPIVSTTVGAIPDTVPEQAGRLVPAGDITALTETLEQLMGDSPLRQQLREGAVEARKTLRSWSLAGEEFDAALRSSMTQDNNTPTP